ncbi:hypothetical protein [Blastococcus sp. URHD0036]|uniref:hypothetical protein n=1 Tax=Blastococcus sp. URHD0036 TaxID=1380356 RepID=UPI00049582BB|nr:hypothetical protein [Blastococcus sp. URHD0036]
MTALVLGLGGCAGPSTEDAAPVTSGPLTDGFDIEPSSSLLGAVFPMPYPYGGEGHQAILRVDGDVERVLEGYVQQAEGLGYLFDVEYNRPEGQRCSRQYSSLPADYPEGCSAYGAIPDDLGQDRVRLGLQGLVEPDGQGYITLSIGLYSNDAPDFSPVPDGPVAHVSDDELAPELNPSTDDPPVHLVEGSTSMIDPLPSTCATGGYVAVLQVTGELTRVLRGYEDQFSNAGFTGSYELIELGDGLIVATEAAGGGTMTAVGVPGDPSYVLVERCND